MKATEQSFRLLSKKYKMSINNLKKELKTNKELKKEFFALESNIKKTKREKYSRGAQTCN